ncbi:MAG TPA: CHRD domain-containing protein [Myxococcus sp.]|jgi:hypothetical protein|nr:CHRD domain-containing protein [Myxococcus sp.]
MKPHVWLAVLMALSTACGGADRFEVRLHPMSTNPDGEDEQGFIYFNPPSSCRVDIKSGFFNTRETVTEVVMMGGSGVVSITFSKSSDSGSSYTVLGNYELSGEQEDEFNAGQMFIVVRTEEHPNGRLRGRIVPVDIPFTIGS